MPTDDPGWTLVEEGFTLAREQPEHEARRKIIREWTSLPKDKRQTEEQAAAFAMKVMERVPSRSPGYRGRPRLDNEVVAAPRR